RRVVPGLVAVRLGPALDPRAARAQPVGPLVDRRPRPGLERDVVDAHRIAVVVSFDLCLAQPDRDPRPREVPDRLAALALDLGDAVVAERGEQLAVERQAPLDRGDDPVDVLDAHVSFATSALRPPFLRSSPRREVARPPGARDRGRNARPASPEPGRSPARSAAAAARPRRTSSGRARPGWRG